MNVPGCQSKIAMDKEEQDKDKGSSKMSCFEEFVVPIPTTR